jgi:TolA-binding protein
VIPIPNEFASELQDCLERYRQRFDPEGLQEAALVESLALTAWRLARIPGLEESLFVCGQVEFADRFSSEDPQERNALIEAHTYLIYEKHFKLLSRQEKQLRRRHEQDEKRLDELQNKRRATAAVLGQRAKLFLVPRKKG